MKVNFLLLILLLTLTSCSKEVSKTMKIVSVPWDILTRTAITDDSIWTISESDTKVVEDQEFIEKVIMRLDRLKAAEGIESIDIRISGLIQSSNQQSDTLSFGNNGVIKFNGDYYSWDEPLFDYFLSVLSENHRSIAKEYFNEPGSGE